MLRIFGSFDYAQDLRGKLRATIPTVNIFTIVDVLTIFGGGFRDTQRRMLGRCCPPSHKATLLPNLLSFAQGFGGQAGEGEG